MQATPVSIHHGSEAHHLAEISGKFSQDFQLKLTLNEEQDDQIEKSEQDSMSEEEEEEEEFSFVVSNPDGSPVSADQAFENGQIRPIYPLFNQNLLYDDGDTKKLRSPVRKVFMEDQNSDKSSAVVVGPYCEWSGKAVEATPQSCKKSNSTGFSKLWRSREFSHRSNSDGKDAFVMFNNNNPNCLPPPPPPPTATRKKKINNDVKGGKGTSSQSHRSYLPYRVGLFTSVHGMTRNLHPY